MTQNVVEFLVLWVSVGLFVGVVGYHQEGWGVVVSMDAALLLLCAAVHPGSRCDKLIFQKVSFHLGTNHYLSILFHVLLSLFIDVFEG